MTVAGLGWTATVLEARPLIVPRRRFVYPAQVEEVERGALELLVRPSADEPFLATCALGFAGGLTGVWPCPGGARLCAVAGGYAYLVDVAAPENWEQVPYRPVLEVLAAPGHGLLLFAGHRRVLAYGSEGRRWESAALSSEGLDRLRVESGRLVGSGWDLLTDRSVPFSVELHSGRLLTGGV